ncbi:hypothetical protein [Phaeobacter gallaeciensis]|uniref:hypothetical protein n=1 Tax=Phaeobacter gallaeciensis TaxID=60890 RepID=UPI0003D6BACA|nr:hypothetical protein [Phaeobacter gallaeciensis]AHD12142.1 hypothetical protein Gal_04438 [Phaeobacter gallaeciensis DSM 26640]ATE95326.1 hypothetical protein PhaeoP11_04342 [Phaeobacter gallaeciensis]
MSAIIEIPLGGASYQMRPEWTVYRNVEARLKFPIPELLNLLQAQRITQAEAATLIQEASRAAGDALDQEAIERCLFEARFVSNPEIMGPLFRLLLALLNGPEKAAKKFEAEVEPILETMATI